MLETTTLKRNLVLEIGERLKNKIGIRLSGFRYLGGYHPQKKIPLGGVLMLP
jgi:hypothetical protein